MQLGSEGLTALAKDGRKLLFPEADDASFADGYAQAVTFGLLVGARNISLKGGVDLAARERHAGDVGLRGLRKNVLRQWFGYRKRDRAKPIIGDRRPPSPLDKIQPEHWPAEYTSDLIDLLNVLGRLIKLEPAQADLLERICAGPLLTVAALREAGAIPAHEGV